MLVKMVAILFLSLLHLPAILSKNIESSSRENRVEDPGSQKLFGLFPLGDSGSEAGQPPFFSGSGHGAIGGLAAALGHSGQNGYGGPQKVAPSSGFTYKDSGPNDRMQMRPVGSQSVKLTSGAGSSPQKVQSSGGYTANNPQKVQSSGGYTANSPQKIQPNSDYSSSISQNIQPASRYPTSGSKNVEMSGDSKQNSKASIYDPVTLNLSPPKTNFDLQQEILKSEGNVPKSQQLSADQRKMAAELGLTEQEYDEFLQLTESGDVESEVLRRMENLNEEEIEAISKMSNQDLEQFAAKLAEQEVSGPSSKLGVPAYKGSAPVKVQAGSTKRPVRSTNYHQGELKKRAPPTVAEKLKELQDMIDRLDETKRALQQEMDNVKKRALQQLAYRRRRGVQEERKEEAQGMVSIMMKRKEMAEMYNKMRERPDMSADEMKILARSMKNMIDKVEGMVKNEQDTRRRRKRSTEEGSRKKPHEQFSFLDFGYDEKGSYSTFAKSKAKRSLKSLFSGLPLEEEEVVERVVPTYHVPDFQVDPEFLSGRFISREMPNPGDVTLVPGFGGGLLERGNGFLRRRRSTDYQPVKTTLSTVDKQLLHNMIKLKDPLPNPRH